MKDEKKETGVTFQSKSEIALAIQVLTPFALQEESPNKDFSFAIEKIKELAKLL